MWDEWRWQPRELQCVSINRIKYVYIYICICSWLPSPLVPQGSSLLMRCRFRGVVVRGRVRPLVPGLGFWPSSLSCQTLGMALGFWLRPDGRNGHTLPPVLARSTLEDMGPVLCTQASLGASQTYRSFVRHSPAHLLCPPAFRGMTRLRARE